MNRRGFLKSLLAGAGTLVLVKNADGNIRKIPTAVGWKENLGPEDKVIGFENIKNINTPTSLDDAATKDYMDGLFNQAERQVGSLNWREASEHRPANPKKGDAYFDLNDDVIWVYVGKKEGWVRMTCG